MDLNSLPDELIAGIFKYNKYETVRDIRKRDSRMDRIGKHYNLGTIIPVEKLVFYFGHNSVRVPEIYGEFIVNLNEDVWNYLKFGEFKNRGEAAWWSRLPDTQEEIVKLFCRIKISKRATVVFDGATIDDRFLKVLCKTKNCFKNVEHLHLCINECDTFAPSTAALKQFFDKCDNLHILEFFTSTGLDVIANSEVIGDRKWSKLLLYQNPTGVKVELDGTDKEFLYRVVRNCNSFCIALFHEVKMCLTVDEFLNFVEDCLLVDNFFTNQSWNLPLLTMGDLTIRNLCRRLEAIEELNQFVIERDHDVIICGLKLFNDAVKMLFTFEGRSETIIYQDGRYPDDDDDEDEPDDDEPDEDDEEP